MKPSKTQLALIARMLETGQPVVRWPGGFWATKGTPEAKGKTGVPSWCVGTQTVMAMDRAGLLKRKNVHPEHWRDERELTESAIAEGRRHEP